MSILVTGGAGFIGSHLVELLLERQNAPVICLDDFNDYYDPAQKRANLAEASKRPQFALIEADVRDAARVEQVMHEHDVRRIVHLAAYAGVRASIERPQQFMSANVDGTLTLLEAARRKSIERFVLASSSTVYGAGLKGAFFEDGRLGIPLSPYGVSKRAAELLALNYGTLHRVPVVCLRPFSVYGPRLRPDLALCIFARAILEGRPLPLFGDGSARRDFTFVTDVCEGIYSALEQEKAVGQCINLGHDEPVVMRDVIAALERYLGRKAKIDYRPANPADMHATWADLSKARKLLGYQPKVSLDEGIERFAAWFRSTQTG